VVLLFRGRAFASQFMIIIAAKKIRLRNLIMVKFIRKCHLFLQYTEIDHFTFPSQRRASIMSLFWVSLLKV
jgi:hypothetical protein